MKKISSIVSAIIFADNIAIEAMESGIINFSAYAQKIHREVEAKCQKEVKLGSIVIALSRLKKQLPDRAPLIPPVRIKNLTVKTPLTEITYDKSRMLINLLFQPKFKTILADDYFSIISGITEISIIAPPAQISRLREIISADPKAVYENLSAITINFSENEYLETPNMIHALVSALATRRINLIEIISTLTEISFIVREKELKASAELLNKFFA